MSCDVGLRHGSDLVLLWLWCRPVATAPIWSLAWEPPYVAGAAKKKKEKNLLGWKLSTHPCLGLSWYSDNSLGSLLPSQSLLT